MANISVKIGKLRLSNPVLVASGTFGWGEEFKDLINLSELGAIVTKTVTLAARKGNSMPRTIETPCGLLNSIGLQNDGIEGFVKFKVPFLANVPTKIIVSISGETPQEFKKLAGILDKQSAVDAIELNISCPNMKGKTRLVAQDPGATYRTVKAARKATAKALITKLSPNVTDIVRIARAAQDAGSDALSLINTVYGMSVDLSKRKPHLSSIFGGLSGPAIKPIALYMVSQVAQKVKLPVIGMGGIMNAQDALEFIITGASAVCVGTGNFVNPRASIEIVKGIREYLIKQKIKDVRKLIGALRI
ncbi:MAG: dihydroorotate dehydrogenase [Candidatus Omnitrophota bacterium]